jgi:phage-related protein
MRACRWLLPPSIEFPLGASWTRGRWVGDTTFGIQGPWTVLFYEDVRGRQPVREWLDELGSRSPAEQGAVLHHIDLLAEFGVLLGEPYSRQLSGRLRELRAGPWRVTYFADPRRRFILLTSFRKRTRKTDREQIREADRLMQDWLDRMGGSG